MSASPRPIRKLLAANRGEIAIRIFRACTELNIRTVAIYSGEDHLSIHRYKADEAFEVGTRGQPVQAYLDQDAIIAVALAREVDAIHPGYGFLSENASFARKCAQAGITFIGPSPDVLDMFGDKISARKLAIEAGVPVVPGTEEPTTSVAEARAFADQHGYPILLKAAFGGGGRGMRAVHAEDELEEAFARATNEATAAFGRGEMFCEKLVLKPRHIEVQILADQHGNRVHLFERDCSVQRRHQKVVEVAPAIALGENRREQLTEAALRIAARSNYTNAGTVEFLLDGEGNHYFIEVNPRIQVEHTITEEITGRDLVQAQIRVAEGKRLDDSEIGISSQSAITRHGFAIQCRVTTEDPTNNFMPDTGKIRAYRSAAGMGIRLDTGTAGAGTVVTEHYDSLIVKVIAHGRDFEVAAAKARRSLREFRIRGVKTNIPFLYNVVSHPRFLAGTVDTTFVDTNQELYQFPRRRDRATKLLRTIAHTVVNGPPGVEGPIARPQPLIMPQLPEVPDAPAGDGTAMAVFRRWGAQGLSEWLRSDQRVWFTDTTFRDAHQSLLATRVRTSDMMAVANATSRLQSELFSLEMWGGATFDVAYRFLKESPWDRLERLREAIPNILFQMLFRGSNAVGYTNYPDNVIRRFIRQAAASGNDVFRIFDALNWVPNMAVAMDEVGKAGKIVEACLCYTGDVSDPDRTKYDLDYYVKLGCDLKEHGAHILAIKDMAGLLRPYAARMLVEALHAETGLPVHLHTHDTSGNGVATLLMAVDAGVDVIDTALSSMSGLTSQPSLNAIGAALQRHERQPLLDLDAANALAEYWHGVRGLYYPFESGLKASTADVYRHEIPGGQYSNLRPRAVQLGLGARWHEVTERYREVNDALGDLVKVTPTSKVVADFAMFLVQNELSVEDAITQADRLDFPTSVTDFFAGRLGQPYGGFPARLQSAVLKGTPPLTERVGANMPDHPFDADAAALERRLERPPLESELLSHALYPAVFKEFLDYTDTFGDVSILPTPAFMFGLDVGEEIEVDIEVGKTLVVKLVAIGGLDDDGMRMVFFELNGQPREISVEDLSVAGDTEAREKADASNPQHVGATMPGKVVDLLVAVGDKVVAGDKLLVLEAMKMETAITAPGDGTVARILVSKGSKAKGKDLLMVLE